MLVLNTKQGGAADSLEGQEALRGDLDRLEHQARTNGMKFNKSKGRILHLGRSNARHESKLGEELLEKGIWGCWSAAGSTGASGEDKPHAGGHQTQHDQPVERGDCPAVFSVGAVTPRVRWAPPFQKDVYASRGGEQLVTGLEGMSCEEQLRTLGLSSLEKRRLRGNLVALCSFLRRGRGEGGVELFSQGSRERTPGNGSKLYPGRFRLDIRKRYFTERAVTPWNRLPGEVNLNSIKRCLLISYNTETQLLDFRHYSVKVVPVGVSKSLKKLLQEKFPNMSRLEDISELLVKDINLSESEAEQDGTHNVLELPQAYAGRGNMKAQQSAVRLTEIGPRMTLQLIKVEEGLAQGNVLYHSFIHKMEAEVKEILARKEVKLQLKAERRQKQEANVERKRQQREAHRERSLAGIRRKRQQDGDSDAEDPGAPEHQDAAEQSEESDAEYYRQEVGEEPDKDLFPDRTKRKRSSLRAAPLRKRRRHSRPEHPDTPSAHPTAPGKQRQGNLAPRDSRHRGRARQGAAGRKPHRRTERPAREGAGPGSGHAASRPKGRGNLLTKGKMIFRRPGRAKKGKR
ncbi:suppressor of SWI4 1 homolog isoform X1 [Accipiter gentilis]|uniref:suppressor of SWI4 1 homolog isoform X1 n=1 Tax=Astur gentilis TaxID=8957 RepID=UPI002110B960|nr:suppressor of SWI4 1 homolog isoform X1 [Accipiter gentilis]